jgi:hypothetical protein
MLIHPSLFGLALVLVALTATWAAAWERGNHAGDWTKGATIKVFVDPIPAGAPAGTAEAVTDAIKEWNDAQAPFGGLTLMTDGADKTNSEIHIRWASRLAAFGVTSATKGADAGFTNTTVKITVEVDKGLDARGITRILKHELGHAEGLGHSAKSDLMKADAYSSNPGKAPSVADLNNAGAFTPPTDDDKAGKKALWGTVAPRSKSEDPSSVIFNGSNWLYDYRIHALNLPGLIDPVTEFTIDMLPGIGLSDFAITAIPTGWHSAFFDGTVDPSGTGFDDEEAPSPSLLSFLADVPSFGIQPGQTLDFQISSPFGPADTRAFTNSPNFDSDEFLKQAPARVPEPSTLLLFVIGTVGLVGYARFFRVSEPRFLGLVVAPAGQTAAGRPRCDFTARRP